MPGLIGMNQLFDHFAPGRLTEMFRCDIFEPGRSHCSSTKNHLAGPGVEGLLDFSSISD